MKDKAQAGRRSRRRARRSGSIIPSGVGISKLSPALIDKASGSPTTGRNCRTVVKLKKMPEA